MQLKTHTTAVIESLESRRLLSAVGDPRSAVLDDTGRLVVTGSNKPDVIRIALDADDNSKLNVSFNGRAAQFNLSQITNGVHVATGNGNDRVIVEEDNGALTLDMTILGGNGTDSIVAGSGNDHLEGNNGKDKLWGGGGNDSLFGANGNDDLRGQDGNDELFGGNGKDRVDGGDGDDRLSGGLGKDALFGGAGNDVFSAEDRPGELKDKSAEDSNDSIR